MNDSLPVSYEERKAFFQNASVPYETRRAIRKHWRIFGDWCRAAGKSALPCERETLEAFLIHLHDKGLRNATLNQAKWAIDWLHRQRNLTMEGDAAACERTAKGLRRTNKRRLRKRAALTAEEIGRFVFADDLAGSRDRLVIMIGFVGGLRRSEIVALETENVEFHERGMTVWLLASKTNAFGDAEAIHYPFAQEPDICAVRAARDWLERSGVKTGRLLRGFTGNGKLRASVSAVTVGQLVKRYASSIGLDPADYCGHSLRSGCVTHLLKRKVPVNVVARHLRHRRIETTMGYDRNLALDQIQDAF